jgi:hypothetical protein
MRYPGGAGGHSINKDPGGGRDPKPGGYMKDTGGGGSKPPIGG